MISDKRVFQLLGLSVIMCFSQCGLNDKPKEPAEKHTTSTADTSLKNEEQKAEEPKTQSI